MIRGISFKIPQEMTDTLWKIFRSIDVLRYDWYVPLDQREVWSENDEVDFFDREYYSGNLFLEHIQKNHRVVFLKIQAYLGQCDLKDLHSYDEYIKSNCKLILLVYDCEYVEIYMKNSMEIEKIYRDIKNIGYSFVEYITDENDRRTKMDVL